MVNPCPGYSITTPYWKAGSAWGCGYHDGVDYASPAGTDVVAAWSGTVVEVGHPTSFGPAFGLSVVIDHDHLPDGSPGGWGLYAHLSKENVSVGQRVEAGQKIGDVGTTGNSSGNHLHFGVYMTDHWVSCGGKNPQPWIEAGMVEPGDVYLSKLVYGQEDSDSVSRLQMALNDHSLEPPGDQMLPITGNYAEMTDEVVRADQLQHGYGNDPVKASSVGPKQAEHLFAGTGNTVINDLPDGTPPPETEEPPPVEQPPPVDLPETITLPLGIVYHYSGKPSGTFSFSGTKKYLDVATWTPPKDGFTFGMIYANVDIDGEFRSYLARQNPVDETAFQTHFGDEGGDNYLLTHVWFEAGEANRGLRYGLYSMDGATGTVGTRYVKFLFIPKDIIIELGQVLGVYRAAREAYTIARPYLPKAALVLFIAWLVKELRKT